MAKVRIENSNLDDGVYEYLYTENYAFFDFDDVEKVDNSMFGNEDYPYYKTCNGYFSNTKKPTDINT